MPTYPSDFIQDGYVTTLGADGEVASTQHLNPQQLATDATRDKVLTYCTENVPEGIPWTYVDLNAEMTGPNHSYNCPSWNVVAANGQKFNAGQLYFDLFNYSVPTQSTVTELHTLAGAAPVS
jgi:hypothetical protein